jgi:hypothetical protein
VTPEDPERQEPEKTEDLTPAERAERHERLEEVFGVGRGNGREANDARLLRDVPPHHG